MIERSPPTGEVVLSTSRILKTMHRYVLTVLSFLAFAVLSASPSVAIAQVTAQPGAFIFSPGDRLVITVWPDSSLGGVFPIEDTGLVHLPLLGPRQALGKTVESFRQELRAGYSEDLQLPAVSVQAQFRVGILGAVRSPGVYWVDPSYGVFELISTAGGFLEDAKEDEIVMTRATGESYQIMAARLQIPGSAEAALALRSGDRLVVPEGGGWNWGIFLQSLTLVATIVNIATR